MKFHVVIPVFNRLSMTLGCLESLSVQTDKVMNVVLVDDGSTDDTSEVVLKRFPEVHILEGNGDLWWTGAINLGIRHVLSSAAPGDYVVLVNNDTYFEPDFITRCRETAQRYPNALIGSVLVDTPLSRTILSGGSKINWYTAKYTQLNLGKSIDGFPPRYVEAVSILTGRGVMIPCKVFHEVGLYDDRHFKQCGDTEFSRRANLKGFPLYVSYDLISYNSDLDIERVKKYYLAKDFFHYFFGVRSNSRLKYRYWFSVNTSINKFQMICYFVFDLVRITVHFLVRVRSRMAINEEK